MTAPQAGTARPRGARDLFGSVPFPLARHVSPHGQVTAVSMMKDEGPYVLEWVAHHLAIGFTDLVVFTNDCTDGTDDMLIRLEALGLAHHRRNDIPEGQKPQPSALNHAQVEPVVCQSDWVMVFDADEFLSIRHGDGTLDGLIDAARAQDANGIVITWRIFGSGGVVGWSRAPVTEQYLMAAPPEWNKGWGVKTLFRFEPDCWKLGIHRPKMKTRLLKTDFPDRVKWLNGSGRPMEDYFKFRGWRSITRTLGYDWVQLNHYAVKSVESYAIRKLRGNVNNKKDKYNADYWSLQDRNEMRDDTMLRYSERRDAIIAALLSDPVLAQLHFTALERVEQRLQELRQTEAYHALVADLARASAVPIGQIVAKPPQARDREKIATLMSDVEKARNAQAKATRRSATPEQPAPAAPPLRVTLGNYSAAPELPDPPFTGQWVANHGIELPLDARIFNAAFLPFIAKGKFDRPLARRMPQVLPKAATVLDVGAGVGFLGVHLAAVRPDLTIVLQEDDPALLAMMNTILARNGRSWSDQLRRDPCQLAGAAEALAALIGRHRATSLIVSAPALTPESLTAALRLCAETTPVSELFLCGRLMANHHGDAAPFDAALAEAGFQRLEGFDRNVALCYRHGNQITAPSDTAAHEAVRP